MRKIVARCGLAACLLGAAGAGNGEEKIDGKPEAKAGSGQELDKNSPAIIASGRLAKEQKAMLMAKHQAKVAALKPRLKRFEKSVVRDRLTVEYVEPADDRIPVAFRSKKAREARLKEMRSEFAAAEGKFDDVKGAIWIPFLTSPATVNRIGRMAIPEAKIVQVIDDHNARVEISLPNTVDTADEALKVSKVDVWLSGPATRDVADGATITLNGVYWFPRTERYQTTLGAPRTVMVMERFDANKYGMLFSD